MKLCWLGTSQDLQMHRRVSLRFAACWLWLVWSCALPTAALAEISIVPPAADAPVRAGGGNEYAQALDHGQSLESERRWGEALTHYEEQLRKFPRDPAILQRLELARMHYELGRRYSDPSYKRTIKTLPEREAVDLYLEVLLKIQSHYVETPNWKQLIDHSTRAFQVALADAAFVENNLPNVPAGAD